MFDDRGLPPIVKLGEALGCRALIMLEDRRHRGLDVVTVGGDLLD
jgi:hypothetical protein